MCVCVCVCVCRRLQIVSLDRNFERLADSAERLVEWADSLMRRKEQVGSRRGDRGAGGHGEGGAAEGQE